MYTTSRFKIVRIKEDRRRLVTCRETTSSKIHQRIRNIAGNKQKQFHDQSAKELPQIPNRATVMIHEKKSWPTKAKVIKKAASPRSYNVQTENGTLLRRNRRDLLHTKEPFTLQPSEIDLPFNEPKKATTSNLPHPSSYRSRLQRYYEPTQALWF